MFQVKHLGDSEILAHTEDSNKGTVIQKKWFNSEIQLSYFRD